MYFNRYKYRTRAEGEQTLVMRTFKENKRWPSDELDMETLIVDTMNRKQALCIAKGTAPYHWG